MDTLLLSRIQFAVTIAFHYIYPPLSIGLGIMLVVMEGLYLKTRDEHYLHMAKFWVKIFGLTFSLGVATGIVMEFEFGTNWATYSRFVGDVFGSALAAEGIFAFFLESGFLGLLLFGWNRIGPKMHFFSTCMVSLGSMFSAIWIVVANSWQQTPAGYHIVGEGMQARAEITDFWALVFNPSTVDRLTHTLCGCWQAGAWLVLSVSAFYLLQGKYIRFAKTSMKIGLIVAILASFGQLATGHKSAIGVSKNQPEKMAAFEGHYSESDLAPLYLFGWVDDEQQVVKYGIKIPGMLSFLIHGDCSKPVTGLKAVPPEDRPPVNMVFQTYHAMVGIGMGLIGLSCLGVFLWWRDKLWTNKWVLRIFVLAVLGPQFANQLGWISAEVGRQPWVVYKLMRTSEGLSQSIAASHVMTSLILFTFIYFLLFIVFIYLLDHKIKHGPVVDEVPDDSHHRA